MRSRLATATVAASMVSLATLYSRVQECARQLPTPNSQRPTPNSQGDSSLDVTGTTLENNRLMVKIARNGDIASIYDKDAKHELLSAPVMLELRDNLSPPWPAWEVLYDTVQGPAREYVSKPTIRIIERGPVRVALEITRRASGSTFVRRVRVNEGGDRVDVDNVVDWKSPNSLLKARAVRAATSRAGWHPDAAGDPGRSRRLVECAVRRGQRHREHPSRVREA